MPKDEFDFDDPMELNGVAVATDEDTTEAMTECFIEEFMLMGNNPKQLLALFRNPHYLGMNMVLQNRGEQFVRDKIVQIFARWGRPIHWPSSTSNQREEVQTSSPVAAGAENQSLLTSAATQSLHDTAPDPLGDPN
jgi:hypothetical protein